jgi:predicted nuclease with TOPRIM domain
VTEKENIMTEYQYTVLFAFVICFIALWMCCRFYYRDSPRKVNRRGETDVPEPEYGKQMQSEQLQKEKEQLKVENGQLKAKLKQVVEICQRAIEKNKRLAEQIKTVKGCNEILKEALEVIREANRKEIQISQREREEIIPVQTGNPENDPVFDSGTMPDEFEAMVQVMKGRPVSGEVQRQAVQAMQKTEGTEIYSHLLGSISGAQERVREALNGMEQTDSGNGDASGSFDVMRYVRV